MFSILARLVPVAALALCASLASGQGVVFPVAPDKTLTLADGTSVEEYSGTVQSVRGNRLTVRFAHGERFTYEVPDTFRFIVGGRKVGVGGLRRGDALTAHVTRRPQGGHVLHELDQPTAPTRSMGQVQHTATPDALPSTASFLPLVGMLGALSFLIGALGFGLRRRLS